MKKYFPKKIIVENDVLHEPLAERVLRRCPDVPAKQVDSIGDLSDEGGMTLVIRKNRGRTVKPCPATPRYLCCDYRILDFSANCSMSCVYCILQSYLEERCLTIYANVNDMKMGLRRFFDDRPGEFHRIGTGEFTDSLILEHLTGFHSEIIPFFPEEERAFLEIKTKTDNIESLPELDGKGKIAVAWSLNTERIIAGEEFGVASLDERLRAASRCREKGYVTAFHFDPLIRYDGWEKDYSGVVKKLAAAVDPADIVYISLGCFRFMPELKEEIETRFPGSRIIYDEFIKGGDGKMRYLKPLRMETYRVLVSALREWAPNLTLYFCMERKDVWEKVLGFSPEDNGELNRMLIRSWRRKSG